MVCFKISCRNFNHLKYHYNDYKVIFKMNLIKSGSCLIQSAFILIAMSAIHAEGKSIIYSIKPNDSDEVISCSKFSSNPELDTISCYDPVAKCTWKYKKNDVIVLYNNIKIYPYQWDLKKLSSYIKNKECNSVIENLYGAYHIDKKINSYIPVAYMYENGICIEENKDIAVKLYEQILSNDPQNSAIKVKINKIKAETSNSTVCIIDNDNNFFECNKFAIKLGNTKCISSDNVENSFSKDDIKLFYYQNELIYPYDLDWADKFDMSFSSSACQDYKQTIIGPMFFANDANAILIQAKIAHLGLCENPVDKEFALNKYREAQEAGLNNLSPIIESLTAEIEKERIAKAEQDRLDKIAKDEREREAARMDAILQEQRRQDQIKLLEIESTCESDCSVNKYQYNTSCYQACLKAHGAY